MTPRRIALVALLVALVGLAMTGMVRYTRRVDAAIVNTTVDGGTITLLRERTTVQPFIATDIGGTPVSLSSLRGKVVLVNFWATWCPPCREEIPDLVALQARYKDELQIVGISQDSGSAADVARFAREHGMNYPTVMSTPDIERLFPNVYALPTTFVIDREGRLAQKHVGLLNISRTEAETRALAGLPVNARVEYAEDTDKVKLENAAQANKIPGIDLSGLSPEKKAEVLKKLNAEPCSCGCGQTVAQCRLEDPNCDVSLPLAKAIVAHIVAEK
jgi:cytochrome c biogenesis protein CcmG/thiol:disulfide interchange protein DsbE